MDVVLTRRRLAGDGQLKCAKTIWAEPIANGREDRR